MDENIQSLIEEMKVLTNAVTALAQVQQLNMTDEQRARLKNIDILDKDNKSILGNINALDDQNQALKSLRESAERYNQQMIAKTEMLKSVTSATKKMFSDMLAQDPSRSMAKYTKSLESVGDSAVELSKHFGKGAQTLAYFFSGLTKVIGAQATQFDNLHKANDQLAKLGTAGSFTINELREMANAAGVTSRNMDVLIKPTKSLGSALTSLGSTTGEGVKVFADMAKITNKQRETYQMMGVSQEELMQNQADYVQLQRLSGITLKSEAKDREALKRASLEYTDNLLTLSAVTGEDAATIKKRQQEALAEERFQISQRMLQQEISDLRAKGEDKLADQKEKELKGRTDFLAAIAAMGDSQLTAATQARLATGTWTEQSAYLARMGVPMEKFEEALKNGADGTKTAAKMFTSFNTEMDKSVRAFGPSAKYSTEITKTLGMNSKAMENLSKYQGKDLEEVMKKTAEERKKSGEDPAQQIRAKTTTVEIEAGKAMDKLVGSSNILTGGLTRTTVSLTAFGVALIALTTKITKTIGADLAKAGADAVANAKLGGKAAVDAAKAAGSAKTIAGNAAATLKTGLKGIGAAGGIGLAGMGLDVASAKLKESGHEKTAAGADMLSSAAFGASLGMLAGPIGAAIGGALGGAYGLYQNWGTMTGGKSEEKKEKPKAAEGGIFDGPKSGYTVEMHGKEAVVPLGSGKKISDLGLESLGEMGKTAFNAPKNFVAQHVSDVTGEGLAGDVAGAAVEKIIKKVAPQIDQLQKISEILKLSGKVEGVTSKGAVDMPQQLMDIMKLIPNTVGIANKIEGMQKVFSSDTGVLEKLWEVAKMLHPAARILGTVIDVAKPMIANMQSKEVVTDNKAETKPSEIESIESDKKSMPKAATGGIFEGPTSGYPIELHGREKVEPIGTGKKVGDLDDDDVGSPVKLDIEEENEKLDDFGKSLKDTVFTLKKFTTSVVKLNEMNQKELDVKEDLEDSDKKLKDVFHGTFLNLTTFTNKLKITTNSLGTGAAGAGTGTTVAGATPVASSRSSSASSGGTQVTTGSGGRLVTSSGAPVTTGGGQSTSAAGSQTGADMTSYLKATALLESGGQAGAKAGTSSAAGMFQFTEGTWKQMTKEMGANYSLEDRFDPKKSAEVMQFFTQKQKSQLEKGTGKAASSTDLYMAHFLGASGATKFINAMTQAPDTIAADLDPKAAAANKSIYFDKEGKPRTVQQVYDLMAGKMGKAEKAVETGKWGGKALPSTVTSLNAPAVSRSGEPVTTESGSALNGKLGDLDKILTFGDKSGSKSNFESLDESIKSKVIAAATELNNLSGKKIKINSAKRDSEDQERLWDESIKAGRPGKGPSGMPIAKPGTSLHEQGYAVDVQNYMDQEVVAALNKQGLAQTVPKDPVHFQIPKAKEGGIFEGPATGYLVEQHGREITAPLDANSILEKLAKTPATALETNNIKPFNEVVTPQADSGLADMLSEKFDEMIEKLDDVIATLEQSNDTQDKMLKYSMV